MNLSSDKLGKTTLKQIEDIPWQQSLSGLNYTGEVKVKLSRVRLFATSWTVACQAPLSMEFSRQDYWSGLPFSSPGDLPKLGIKPRFPALQADSLPAEPLEKPGRLLKKRQS